LLSTHALPDGDGLGAETALYHYLKRSKKSVRVYNPDPIPKRYQFLDPKETIIRGPGQVELWDQFDVWIIVDTNDPRRLDHLWSELSIRAKKIVFLDHHPDTLDQGEGIKYPPHASVVSDVTSSSIGELLYRLFNDLDSTTINQDVALGLYVSVMTDTNSFRYARTTPIAHQIAGEMIALGVNPEEVYQSIYSSKEVTHLQLLGHMLQNVKTSPSGKLAWLEMDKATRRKHRASADDTQSFLNLLLLLRDAEVVCLFREEDDESVRVSIKSKGRVVVNRVAMEFGGGGHDFAAGLAISAPLKKTVKSVTDRLEDVIDHFLRFGK
ncbi:MAG: hypothetical protein KDD43_13455, partial [Bdellovibrionales bacterium]|nr:hypothetical protein [Bdellovibrionales bacterium]